MACGRPIKWAIWWLHYHIGEYIEEEMGHQNGLLDDIAAWWVGLIKSCARLSNLATELMLAYAYDMIQRSWIFFWHGVVGAGEPQHGCPCKLQKSLS
jgi:hypothetical protein